MPLGDPTALCQVLRAHRKRPPRGIGLLSLFNPADVEPILCLSFPIRPTVYSLNQWVETGQ